MAILRAVVFALPALLAQAGSTGQLLDLLRHRDSSLSSLQVAFHSSLRREPSGERYGSDESTICEGRYSMSGRAVALSYSEFEGGQLVESHEALWDGTILTQLTRHGSQSHAGEWRAVKHIQPAITSAVRTYFPLQFGLTFFDEPWPTVLSRSPALQVLPREPIDGRDCFHIVFDCGPSANKQLGYPVEVWFDDKSSLLAVRTIVYSPTGQSEASGGSARTIDWGGRAFVSELEWRLVEVLETDTGYAIPKVGVQTAQDGYVVTTRVEPSSIVHGAGLFEVDLSVPPKTVLVDSHSRQTSALDSSGQALSIGDAALWQSVHLACRTFGYAEIDDAPSHVALDKSACGPNALYFCLRVLGHDRSLSDVLSAFPGLDPNTGGETSLQSLAVAAEGFGLDVACVDADASFLRTLRGIAIAQTTGSFVPVGDWPASEYHFVAAGVAKDGQVWVFEPPFRPSRVSIEEFAKRWTGRTLLLDRRDVRAALDTASNRQSWQRRATYATVLLVAVIGIAAFCARRAR